MSSNTAFTSAREKAQALDARGLELLRQGDASSASLTWRQAIALYSELGDDEGRANTLHNLGTLHLNGGDFDGALPWLEEAFQSRTQRGDILGAASSRHNIALCLAHRGEV